MASSIWRHMLGFAQGTLPRCIAPARSTVKREILPFRTLVTTLCKKPGLMQPLPSCASTRNSRPATIIPFRCVTTEKPVVASQVPEKTESEAGFELTKSQRQEVISTVCEEANVDQSRKNVFAVIHLSGRQFKVTVDDVVIAGPMLAEVGERIRLEKVLLVAGRNFSLIGRPLLSRNIVKVEATVTEKAKGYKIIIFKMKKRKNYKRWRGFRPQHTVLRINSITINTEAVENREE